MLLFLISHNQYSVLVKSFFFILFSDPESVVILIKSAGVESQCKLTNEELDPKKNKCIG